VLSLQSNHCTSTMQNRLQQHPNFGDILKDNLIRTLEAIKVLTHNPVRVVYPMEALTNALKNFLLARQNKGKTTIEYIKRRKQIGATLLQFLGPLFLDHFVKTTEWYSKADDLGKATLLKQSSQIWQSYLLLKNGEKETYEDLIEHL